MSAENGGMCLFVIDDHGLVWLGLGLFRVSRWRLL